MVTINIEMVRPIFPGNIVNAQRIKGYYIGNRKLTGAFTGLT